MSYPNSHKVSAARAVKANRIITLQWMTRLPHGAITYRAELLCGLIWHQNIHSNVVKCTNVLFHQPSHYEALNIAVNVQDAVLTHAGRVTHICVGKLTIIGSDNGLSPDRRQAIIWTNAGILLIRTLGTNFSEILSEIYIFSFKKIHLKMSSGKRRPFCLGLNVLT